MAIKKFVDQFHSLSGKTIGEKLKNLNQLIIDVKSECLQHDIDQFIAEAKPANNFEKLLKGKIIDSFRKSQELLDVLKCGDRLFIKQVLHCDWFFEGSTADFPTCEFFITDVFPNTSFNTRNDIIHLLSVHLRDVHVAEQFFRIVRSEYGIQQARPLLCVCSTQFIQSILDIDDGVVHFTDREVSKLVRKYPDLVKVNIEKKCFATHLLEIVKVMLDVDVKIFIELFEIKDCDVNQKIGRRGSKKILRCNPAAVIKSAKKYINILKPRYLHKYLTAEDFTEFYVGLFPESYNEDPYFFQEYGNFYRVVDVVTPKKRLEMLLSCFEKVYGEKLLTKTKLVGKELLQLLPPDQREMCAQQKMDSCANEDEDETCWICYLTIEKSVPLLKKCLMEAPDLDSRCNLISYLILTCKINEDLEALASVCAYIVSRYRNDRVSLRARILTELTKHFDFLKLDDRHWTKVLELIKIIFLNEEHHNYSWLISSVLSKSVHYKLNNHADISEQIDQLIITTTSGYINPNGWIILKDEPKYQQVIFQALGERIPLVKKVKCPLTDVAVSLLDAVSGWNKSNKLFQSSLCRFPWAVESLRKIVDTDLGGDKKEVLKLLQHDLETKQLVCPEHAFIEEIEKDVQYFLKMDTEIFVQNAQKELEFLLTNDTKKFKHLFITWNLMSCTQIKEIVVRKCKEIVEKDQDTSKIENAIFVLSFLMEAVSFAHLIKPFHPVAERIDPADEKTEKMLPLIRTSALYLKNVNPWNDYSSIIQFCKGDYLKYILGSLMSVCYNAIQIKIVPFLEGLTNSPVSVKKHAMRLSFSIVSRPQLLPLLNNLWCADQNPATREVLLALVWRAFLTEPTADMFKLLKYCLKSLRVVDKNMFNKLSNDTHIPDNYKAEYVELCWEKLHDLLEQGAKTNPLISGLVSRFESLVEWLSSSFCERVLKQYLSEGSPHKEACINFAAVYVLKCHTQEILNERFKLIADLLKQLLACSAAGRNDIASFISSVCTDVLICKYNMAPQVLQKLVTFLPSVLNPVYKFETFMLLNFTSLYFSCMPEFNLVSFGKVISGYITSVMEEYGPESIILVSTTFNQFVNSVETWHHEDCEKRATCINVITGLLTEPVSKYTYIVAAYLIPVDFANPKEVKDKYIHFIQTIFRVQETAVCLVINSLPVFENNLTLLDNAMQTDTQ